MALPHKKRPKTNSRNTIDFRSFSCLFLYTFYCPGADTVPDTEELEPFPLPDGPPDETFPEPGLVGAAELLPGWLAALVGVVLPAAVGTVLPEVLSLVLPGWLAAVVGVVLPG